MQRSTILSVSATAAAIVLIDQLTKAWVLAHASDLSGAAPPVGLTLTMNRSIAFSLPVTGGWVYVLAAAVVALVGPTLVRSLDWSKPWSRIIAGALAGGAVGNLIDRIRFGAVVDFLKVGWWPVFNVADAALSLSVVALLVFGNRLFMPNTHERRHRAARANAPERHN